MTALSTALIVLHRQGFLRVMNRLDRGPRVGGSTLVQVRCPRFLVRPVARWLAVHGRPTESVDRDSVRVQSVKRVGSRTFHVLLTYSYA